ncbi:hypothetical protein [Streptomyces europaeiscabiei]|uniref:hypothetical protein n=1 Tax=Streptomyces europaeiscabiei TaxID=146819 RepID=UPI002E0F7FD2|nr:hypothetical protein OHB30_49210 [Streptomyces europaeiscabiei]
MARPSTSGDWTAFLAEHFGFDTAVGWITVSLELFTEHLQAPPDQPSSANFPESHRD